MRILGISFSASPWSGSLGRLQALPISPTQNPGQSSQAVRVCRAWQTMTKLVSKMSPRTFNLMGFFFFIFNIKFVTKTDKLKERCKRSKKGKQARVTSFAG